MGLFGGSKTTIPATGYYALPQNIRDMYDQFIGNIPGATSPSIFTPPEFNQDQLSAFNMVRNAAAPTAESIQNLTSAYMNPYQDSVISEINRQAGGEYSLLKEALSNSGGFGSNRQYLGANDIDLSRQNQIGTFLTNQFNNALNTGLQQQQQNISNLSNIGGQQQQQAFQTQMAPYSALEAGFGLLNPVVQYVGQSTPERTVKTGGSGLGSLLNTAISAGLNYIAPGSGTIFGAATGGGGGFFGGGSPVLGNSVPGVGWSGGTFFSDRRLKENIEDYGEENGYKTYKFSYADDPRQIRYIGVMAQEVLNRTPEAVHLVNGYYAVDYDKIGVKMREFHE